MAKASNIQSMKNRWSRPGFLTSGLSARNVAVIVMKSIQQNGQIGINGADGSPGIHS